MPPTCVAFAGMLLILSTIFSVVYVFLVIKKLRMCMFRCPTPKRNALEFSCACTIG